MRKLTPEEDGGRGVSGGRGTRFVPKKTSSKIGLVLALAAIGVLLYLYG